MVRASSGIRRESSAVCEAFEAVHAVGAKAGVGPFDAIVVFVVLAYFPATAGNALMMESVRAAHIELVVRQLLDVVLLR